MAARLYTHGYDFFAPTEAVIYHLWSRDHRPVFQQIKTDAEQATLKANSLRRVRMLLGLESSSDIIEDNTKYDPFHVQQRESEISFGRYGLGSLRSLKDFEEMACIDLKNKAVIVENLMKHFSIEDQKWEFVENVKDFTASFDSNTATDMARKVEVLNLVSSFLNR